MVKHYLFRLSEFIGLSAILSTLVCALYITHIFPWSGYTRIMLTFTAFVIYAIFCFFLLRDDFVGLGKLKSYYLFSAAVYLGVIAISYGVYFFGGNELYTWLFCVFKTVRFALYVDTAFSMLLSHLLIAVVILLTPITCPSVLADWKFSSSSDTKTVTDLQNMAAEQNITSVLPEKMGIPTHLPRVDAVELFDNLERENAKPEPMKSGQKRTMRVTVDDMMEMETALPHLPPQPEIRMTVTQLDEVLTEQAQASTEQASANSIFYSDSVPRVDMVGVLDAIEESGNRASAQPSSRPSFSYISIDDMVRAEQELQARDSNSKTESHAAVTDGTDPIFFLENPDARGVVKRQQPKTSFWSRLFGRQ